MPWDKTYEWENSPENYKSGAELFAKRNPQAGPNCLDRQVKKHPIMDDAGKIQLYAITEPLMPEPEREEAFV